MQIMPSMCRLQPTRGFIAVKWKLPWMDKDQGQLSTPGPVLSLTEKVPGHGAQNVEGSTEVRQGFLEERRLHLVRYAEKWFFKFKAFSWDGLRFSLMRFELGRLVFDFREIAPTTIRFSSPHFIHNFPVACGNHFPVGQPGKLGTARPHLYPWNLWQQQRSHSSSNECEFSPINS